MRITIDRDAVARNFDKFKDNGSLAESAQLFARGLPIVEMLQAISMNENVLQAFAGLDSVYPHGKLERALVEKVILRVSQLHECQFCVNSHLDLMRSLDISSDLSGDASLAPREELALRYAEAMTRDANRIPEELFAAFRANFLDAEIVELTFVVGLITMLNRFNNALQIRYSSEFVGIDVR